MLSTQIGDKVVWTTRPELKGEVVATSPGDVQSNYRCTKQWNSGHMSRIKSEYLPGRYVYRWVQSRYLTLA